MSTSPGLLNLRSDSTDESRPKYQRVCDHLYAEFRAGRLTPGQSLPPEAKLSEILGVSRNTLRQALGKLEQDGMIERIQGRGTFLTSEHQRESRKKQNAFAFLVPQIREGVYPSLIHGFEQACAGFQHQMVVGNSSNDVGRQADLLMQLMDQAIGGVALVPATSSPTPAYQLTLLQKNHIPVVCCHRTVPGVNAPSLIFVGFDTGREAAQAFVERGHQRIAYLYPHRYSVVDQREAGMKAALAMHPKGATCHLEAVEYGSFAPATEPGSRAAIFAALQQLLTKPDRPTAIFCGNLTEAEQVYLQAGDMGLDVPADLSLICYGSTWREGALAQRISCIGVDEHEIGARAARMLLEMREGTRPLDSNEQVTFPTTLFVGETLASV